MSIIEKAISKSRNQSGARPKADAAYDPVEPERGGRRSHIERAVDEVDRDQVAECATPESPPVREGTRRHVKISRAHLAEMGLISPEGTTRSQLAEEFRLIKRPLLANAFGESEVAGDNRNLVMITSALPREGKSFCTINLAMSIAMELGRTVLLVDADVARPMIPNYLGVDGQGPGLLDLLADDQTDFPDALIRTDIEKLTIMPAGKTYPRATEMLASEGMARLIGEMGRRYPDRIILFDSPPLLATSEASALARHMGQIVYVVEADKTPQDAVARGAEQLDGCEVVVPLLNKTRPLPGMKYAHGYYGAYYGS